MKLSSHLITVQAEMMLADRLIGTFLRADSRICDKCGVYRARTYVAGPSLFPSLLQFLGRHPPPLHLHQHQPSIETIAKTKNQNDKTSKHDTYPSSPCLGESQQQCPLRPEECSQPPPGPASFRPFAQQHLQSQQSVGGSTTRKISRPPFCSKSRRGGDTSALSQSLRHRITISDLYPYENAQLTSAALLDHYNKPRNVGSMSKTDNDVGTGLVGAPACGDVMKLQIRVDPNSNTISDVKFKTFGCGSAIASSSYLTELVRGMTLEDASRIKNTEIAKELCLPPVKREWSRSRSQEVG